LKRLEVEYHFFSKRAILPLCGVIAFFFSLLSQHFLCLFIAERLIYAVSPHTSSFTRKIPSTCRVSLQKISLILFLCSFVASVARNCFVLYLNLLCLQVSAISAYVTTSHTYPSLYLSSPSGCAIVRGYSFNNVTLILLFWLVLFPLLLMPICSKVF